MPATSQNYFCVAIKNKIPNIIFLKKSVPYNLFHSSSIFLLDVLRLQTKLYILTETREKINTSPFAFTYKHITLISKKILRTSSPVLPFT